MALATEDWAAQKLCIDMFIDMRIDMCTDVYIDMTIDVVQICVDMGVDVCPNICLQKTCAPTSVRTGGKRRVQKNPISFVFPYTRPS